MPHNAEQLSIKNKILASRNELLDLSLNNNMLKFRQTQKNRWVIGNKSQNVLNRLYQGGSMRFSTQNTNPSTLCLTQHRGTEIEQDRDRLYATLLSIHTDAKNYTEAQGVNILFLGLGFLHWTRADNQNDINKAPLLLLPVNLERDKVNDTFKVKYSGEDIIENRSLAALLQLDFGLILPTSNQDNEAINIEQFCEKIRTSVVREGWKVESNEIALGFFSFGKFLMFNDLDPENWPEQKQPENNDVIQRLLGRGFGDTSSAYPENVNIDSVIQPGAVPFVKDADSSQTLAILEVLKGNNLLIQGPPGTGKSQTITNIIAALIGENKTVLFVAEKMAALEVVKRRLDDCHLGHAVLELHSHRATKRSVLDALEATINPPTPNADNAKQLELKNLCDTQNRLNRYCTLISSTAGTSGLPLHKVLWQCIKLDRTHSTLPELSFAPMQQWTYDDFNQNKNLIESLVSHLKIMGRPDQNIFWGSTLKDFNPFIRREVHEALQHTIIVLDTLSENVRLVSERLVLNQPDTHEGVTQLCHAVRRTLDAPDLTGIHITAEEWHSNREVINELLESGERMSEYRHQYDQQLIESTWEQDLLTTRDLLFAFGNKWWRFFSWRFHAARSHLRQLIRGAVPKTNSVRLELLDAVITYQQYKQFFEQHAGLGSTLFGELWRHQQSEWPVLKQRSTWIMKLHDEKAENTIPEGLLPFLADPHDVNGLNEFVDRIEQHISSLEQGLNQLCNITGMPVNHLSFTKHGLIELGQRLQLWQEHLDALDDMASFNVLAEQIRGAQLNELLDIAVQTEEPDQLSFILERSWYRGLLQQAYQMKPDLGQFLRTSHENDIQAFRVLDQQSLDIAQNFLSANLRARLNNIQADPKMLVLWTQFAKKKNHLPIRKLIDQVGELIQQIKPVFMMSPMSIANFLPVGRLEFDVVVFDEASQIKPVDAFGAIMRGKQIVVVGDTKQMPPTDFFNRATDNDDENNAVADIDSILNLFEAQGLMQRYLRWHYRSRHESLIAVSNVEFYDNRLIVFPSAGYRAHALGLSFIHLPDNIYDRGKTRTNPGEAQAIAKEVIEHAIKTPKLTLGVAAFSVAQQDRILIEVEKLRKENPECESFFNEQSDESFFIKNLENIQGDERDVIFISIGYGRDESGQLICNFGPLNKEGGERRLNVLITRARMAMRVFCNFTADELAVSPESTKGVSALKNFLKYAQTGQLEIARETGKAVDSPFELEVIEALRNHNYVLEPQVGTAGYFIDIAVKHPDYPGRYLLAIECDGASYHSSRSARDRDRLRQSVLEGLGWRFHRIWSTDWFNNRQREIDRAIKAIEAAKKLDLQ